MTLRSNVLIAMVVLASSPACIALDGCEELTVAEGSGGDTPNGSTVSAQAIGTSSGTDAGGSTSSTSTQAGPAGTGGGGGGGPECMAAEICGVDAGADEDCDGVDPCPAGEAWTWLEDLGGDVIITSFDAAPGVQVVGGTVDGDTCFVSARAPQTGEELWTRTWEKSNDFPVVVLARAPTLVFVAGTVSDDVPLDDGETLGFSGKTFGFVMSMNDDTGTTEQLFYFDQTGGSSYATAIEFLDVAPPRILVGVFHDLDYPLGSGSGPNAFLANLDTTLGGEIRETLFATVSELAFPVAVVAKGTGVAVGISVQGPATPLDGARFDVPLAHPAAAAQSFDVEGGSGTLLVPAAFHSFVGAADVVRLGGLDLASTGALHVAIQSDDVAALEIDGELSGVALAEGSVYVGFPPAGDPPDVRALGAGIDFLGELAMLDVGQTILVSGVASESGEVAGVPISGAFLAEVALVADAELTPTWILPLGGLTGAGVPRFGVDPLDETAVIRVAGELRGAEAVTGSSGPAGVLNGFVGRLAR
jgi:hypothetical protein